MKNMLPSSLIEKIQKNNIVLFVGAGLSINSGFPNWKELTISILKHLKERDIKIEGYISALEDDLFEPIEILSKIEHLKSFAIEGFEKEIRKFDSVGPSTVHNKISLLSSKIITSNYDELLEKSNPDFEKITYYNKYKVSKVSEYDKYIFKIHGDINEPDKCILFPSEYKNLYSHDEKSSIFELKKIFSDKSILFIGFALNDPYINYILNYISELYSGFVPEHFVITTNETNNWGERITPIIIEDYTKLEFIVDELIKVKKNEDTKIEIIRKDNYDNVIISSSSGLEYDIPPNVKYWVGRKKEIENISNKNFQVIFITGIGGQGKSALATQFIKNYFDNSIYEFGDWRDFKEENNRFQTKMISIIKRLTNKKLDANQLESNNSQELVDSFFHYLGDRKIIFVFDNVDSYIDLEDFIPVGGIGYLFKQALTVNHSSRFIFTCRPFIKEAGVNFYQISLNGLSYEESLKLFKIHNIPITKSKLELLAKKAHSLTNGHPLWLNLIAAQAVRGIETANKFIENISNKADFNEENFSSILSQKILNHVWNSLNEKQQILLRGLAETVKPETISNLKTVLDRELKSNQFERAFKTLKNLNLIETKSSPISEDQIELHPLVKEYILNKYPRKERAMFITLLVEYYDNFIYMLKPKLGSDLSLTAFQNWTSKIELEINKEDFIPALIALEEVSSSILSAGYSEEYLRVSEILFDSIDWFTAIEKEYAYFHSQINTLTTTLTQFGKFAKCKMILEKYETLIPGKSSYYLNYCSEMCYLHWYQENYNEAILFGERGNYLLLNSGLQDNNSLKHNLALAWRDSKKEKNIEKALNFFLSGEDLDEILNDSIKHELGGSFYGNVGRCLEFMDKPDNTILCYYSSLKLLLAEDNEYTKPNIGYANSWISEIHLNNKNYEDGLHFLKNAINIWENILPPKAENLRKTWKEINIKVEIKKRIDSKSEWEVEQYCRQKIN